MDAVVGEVQVVAKMAVAASSRDRESLGPLADRTLTKTLPVRPSVTTDGRFSCTFLKSHRTRCQGHEGSGIKVARDPLTPSYPHIYNCLTNPQPLINHTMDKLCPPEGCLEAPAAVQRNPPLQNPANCLMGPARLHNDSGSDSRCPSPVRKSFAIAAEKQTNSFASARRRERA